MSICIVCKKEVKNYKPEYCCNEKDCGCMGLPIEPPLCDSKKCQEKVYGDNTNLTNHKQTGG